MFFEVVSKSKNNEWQVSLLYFSKHCNCLFSCVYLQLVAFIGSIVIIKQGGEDGKSLSGAAKIV